MVATSAQNFAATPSTLALDAELTGLSADRLIIRVLQRFAGASLSMSALALWMVPLGDGGSAELLCKLAVSLTLGYAGAATWQAGASVSAPELEIDLVRREVRLLRQSDGKRLLVMRRRFNQLERATFLGRKVTLWDTGGVMVADMNLTNEDMRASLKRALQDDGVAV